MLAAVAAVFAGAWVVAAGLLYLARRPAEPPVGERTLDLGPEPPAVANFLVHDFRVTDEALPATLIDLAARDVVEVEQRGPGVFYVRLLERHDEALTAYEKRVLDHLRERAHDQVVPAEALTTGPEEQSKRWRRGFESEVVADAQSRGLSRDALDGRAFGVLFAAAVVPAALVWAIVGEWEAGLLVWAVGSAVLEWIRRRHPQRETPAGLEAASRWLGVRAELAENEVFRTHSPLTVELWSRLLAYGAALGVARGASAPLPLGPESDTHAWSAHGGRWRPVRVSYPRLWPPAWGLEPLIAIVAGFGATVAGALALYWLGTPLLDAGPIAAAILLLPCAAVLVGVALTIMAFLDLGATVEVTGPVLRLRAFGPDKRKRFYAAIDDGSSRTIRALRVGRHHYVGLSQGQNVTVTVTRNLGCVRSITEEPFAAPAEAAIGSH